MAAKASAPEGVSAPIAWGRLLRISLAPTALADGALGLLLGARGWPLDPLSLLPLAAALMVYTGGMALNDWADREEDRRSRPGRPLPSGRISPAAALAVAILLLVTGPLLAFVVDPRAGALLGAVALAAAFYDLAGRGPLLGPALLAFCRAGNVSAAVLAGSALAALPLSPELFAPAVAYGVYVFVVSRLGRLEDDPKVSPGHRPRPLLGALAALLVLGPMTSLLAVQGSGGPEPIALLLIAVTFCILALQALPLLRLAGRKQPFRHSEVVSAMGLALRRLLVFQAAAAWLTGLPAGFVVGLVLFALVPLGRRLARTFPPS